MAVESNPTQSSQRFRIDWVLTDELAIGPAPRAERHLVRLKAAGINAVLSLCSVEEAQPPQGLTEQFQCQRIVLPDHRSSDVMTLHQLSSSLLALEQLRQHGAVFVHCVAAVERSPLVCMGWLIKKHKLNPTEAIDYLMQIHRGTNPLPGQFALLHQLIQIPANSAEA